MSYESLLDILRRATTITFDCYGTMIDWSAGLRGSFADIFGAALAPRMTELFDAYVEIEAEIERGPYRSYREVLAECVRGVAKRFDVELSSGGAHRLAEALPGWRPFADTNEALARLKRHYRLGVLSNIDRDLFAGSAKHFSSGFDFVITAEDVRSYKPGLAHFERALEQQTPRGEVVHVAQSTYHDGGPARALDLAFVWINRYKHRNVTKATPVAELPDLQSLADAADRARR